MTHLIAILLLGSLVPWSIAWAGDEPLFRVQEGGKWGFINQEGKIVIKPQYEDIYYQFNDGLAAVKMDGKWGYIDTANRMLIAARFDGAQSFKGGIAAVRVGSPFTGEGKWGYIDKTGQFLIEPRETLSYGGFNDGLMPVRTAEKWGYLNTKGEWAIPLKFTDANDFSEGLAGVQFDSSTAGFIDLDGNLVIRLNGAVPHYMGFAEGLAPVRDIKTGKIGYIDKSGAWKIPPTYSEGREFSQGRAAVVISSEDETGWPVRKWGVIDITGKLIVPAKFDTVWSYKEGLANAVRDGKWGFLDLEGNLVIPCQFNVGEPFEHGLALVEVGEDSKDLWMGYINKQGKFVWRPKDYAKKDKARAVALAAKKKMKPSIRIITDKGSDKKGLLVTCPRKIPFEGKGAGVISISVVNLLEEDVFLDVTGNESLSCSLELWSGGSSGGGGSVTIFPDNTNLLKRLHATSYDGGKPFTCGCCITRIKGKLDPKALKLGRARGTVTVRIAGFYRNSGKQFYELVKLPIELVKQADDQQEGADQPAATSKPKSGDRENPQPESEVRHQ